MERYNEEKIRELAGKWSEGETSLEEERLLAESLRDPDLPADLRPVAALFGFYAQQRTVMCPEAVLSTHNRKRLSGSRILKRLSITALTAAAAIGLIITVKNKPTQVDVPTLTVGEIYYGYDFGRLIWGQSENRPVYGYLNGEPLENPRMAEAYLIDALAVFGENLNRSTDFIGPLEEVRKSFDIVMKIFEYAEEKPSKP